MTPAAIIREAQTDGVTLSISPTGTIKASGDGAAVNRWLSVIREHKEGIVDALKVGAGDTPTASRLWRIHYPDLEPVEVSCTPAATHAQILADYPGAIVAEPFTQAIRRPSAPLTAEEEAAILAWLAYIDETTPEGIADVMTGCRDDADCRAYFLERAKEVPAKPGMVACERCRNFLRGDHPHLGRCTRGEPMAPAGIYGTDVRWCLAFEGNANGR